MKPGQKIPGVALFPMEFLNISQGMNNAFSHRGSFAIDIIGRDGGIDLAYAPFDCTLVWKDVKAGNGLCWQSDRPVLCADGAVDFVTFVMWHKNDISVYQVGQQFKQGDVLYAEGMAGRATGNHIHLNVAKGKYTGGYPLYRNKYDVYCLFNQVPPMDVFFINDTRIIQPLGYEWHTYVSDNEVYRDGLPYIRILAGSLNYRESPNGVRLGVLPQGAELPYLGKTNAINGYTWAELLFEGRLVYCAIHSGWNQIVIPTTEVEVIKEVVIPVSETIDKGTYTISVAVDPK